MLYNTVYCHWLLYTLKTTVSLTKQRPSRADCVIICYTIFLFLLSFLYKGLVIATIEISSIEWSSCYVCVVFFFLSPAGNTATPDLTTGVQVDNAVPRVLGVGIIHLLYATILLLQANAAQYPLFTRVTPYNGNNNGTIMDWIIYAWPLYEYYTI